MESVSWGETKQGGKNEISSGRGAPNNYRVQLSLPPLPHGPQYAQLKGTHEPRVASFLLSKKRKRDERASERASQSEVASEGSTSYVPWSCAFTSQPEARACMTPAKSPDRQASKRADILDLCVDSVVLVSHPTSNEFSILKFVGRKVGNAHSSFMKIN